MGFFGSLWHSMCDFFVRTWDSFCKVLAAMVEFVADLFNSVLDFYCNLLDLASKVLDAGINKLYIFCFGEDDIRDPLAEKFEQSIKEEVKKNNIGLVDIKNLRIAIKTNQNNEVKAYKAYSVSEKNKNVQGMLKIEKELKKSPLVQVV